MNVTSPNEGRFDMMTQLRLLSLSAIAFLGCSCSRVSEEDAQAAQPPPPPKIPSSDQLERQFKAPAKTPASATEALEFLPAVVAKVGDYEIPVGEVKALVQTQLQKAIDGGKPVDTRELRGAIVRLVNRMVDTRLLLELAKADGVLPDMKAGAARLAEMERQMGKGKLATMLKSQGLSREHMLRTAAEATAINAWIEAKVVPEHGVTEAELRAEFDGNKDAFAVPAAVSASHIFIQVARTAADAEQEEAMSKARKVMSRLREGERFETLAQTVSDDKNTARREGALPPIMRPAETGPFEAACWSLEPGQISDIVQGESGLHIIKCRSLRKGKTTTFEEAREDLEKRLKGGKVQEALTAKKEGLRGKIGVQVFVER